jgi:hypothetical protein
MRAGVQRSWPRAAAELLIDPGAGHGDVAAPRRVRQRHPWCARSGDVFGKASRVRGSELRKAAFIAHGGSFMRRRLPDLGRRQRQREHRGA